MVDEQKLRELAEAATPGPWVTGNTDPLLFGSPRNPGTEPIGFVYGPSFAERSELGRKALSTSEYIAAANPAAILSLLDELQTLREERTAWRVTAENAEKDAARYRWIRFAALSEDQSSIFEALESADPDPKSDAEFDAAISAAVKDES